MEKLYALSEADYGILKEVVSAWRNGELGRPQPKPRRHLDRSDVVFGIVDATVAGTTGVATKPASGTMSVYDFTSTGGTTDTGRDETVYNPSATAATTGEWTVCLRDFRSGLWLVVRQNS